ncbi:MAG TPA: helix-turn-helix domain-containing protein [Nitrospirae bacterium]|nr:helix-turn-helix domain-containing protein [Nitrospirota bacterium]HDZ03173.1 helix-turn-helix domain-containing protein [Nitrospirota bacterium]
MDTPGKALKAERKRQKKSLRYFAVRLKINIEYLKAIEDDNYSLLPADIFTKAYLRLYAEALGLENDYILSLYKGRSEAEIVEIPAPSRSKFVFPLKPVLIIFFLVLIIISVTVLMKSGEQKPAEEFVNKAGEQEILKEEKPGTLSLKITATEITWVSVSIDGGKPKEWLLRAGETVTLTAMEKFAVKVGNAGGTRLTLNGEELGVLGPHGKIADIVLP